MHRSRLRSVVASWIGERARAFAFVYAALPIGCGSPPVYQPVPQSPGDTSVAHETVQVVRRYAHDEAAYTEGLEFVGGRLLESTGPGGAGGLRVLSLSGAAPVVFRKNESKAFPEGLSSNGLELFQLTEKAGFAWVWDQTALKVARRVPLAGTGWGLCFDGKVFFRSDGSDLLHRHEPNSFAELEPIPVRLAGEPLRNLNELEAANGFIYANVWYAPEIVKIDPASGRVAAVIDARALVAENPGRSNDDVLNGIAFRKETGTFFLTGKHWPVLYEVIFSKL